MKRDEAESFERRKRALKRKIEYLGVKMDEILLAYEDKYGPCPESLKPKRLWDAPSMKAHREDCFFCQLLGVWRFAVSNRTLP